MSSSVRMTNRTGDQCLRQTCRYRKFYAKLEARKKRTWRIYQAVEYRVERQEVRGSASFAARLRVLPRTSPVAIFLRARLVFSDPRPTFSAVAFSISRLVGFVCRVVFAFRLGVQVKMGDFLSRLITHLPEAHRAHHETASRFDAMVAKGWPLSMEVKDDYTGPNLPTEITIESMVNLIQHYFSNLRAYALEEEPPVHLHVKWVCHVLTSYLKVLQVTPTVVYISTVLPKRITVSRDADVLLK